MSIKIGLLLKIRGKSVLLENSHVMWNVNWRKGPLELQRSHQEEYGEKCDADSTSRPLTELQKNCTPERNPSTCYQHGDGEEK